MKQMEVMVPVQDEDFSFASASSVLVSPQGFENYFFSAPTSPLHQTSNYNYKQDFCDDFGDNNAFAFSICGDLNFPPLCSADELFESGKIKFCEPSRKKIIQNTLSFGRNNKCIGGS
ncbi:hypothetical protein POM88_043308 [Heracleum sosnowskyi]|uniref:Uncharacterized protein n=1 Tax=Heracleum sosnowskyi TaxID=360622 RepID=A0AAD8M409_9APIA|nr:hypothetical protein POM88_043308 [Heracleum sosnowskyi]